MSNDNVNFLLEIMQARTSTRQHQDPPGQDEPCSCVSYACGGSDYDDDDNEDREMPPKSNPANRIYAFDYYGNPVTEQEQQMQLQLQKLLTLQKEQQQKSESQASQAMVARQQPQQQPQVEDFSEFLVENPHQDDIERGCIAEFGQFLSVSLCGGAEAVDLTDALEQEQMRAEINRELQDLRQETVDAKTSKVMLEFDLRAELIEIRRQKAEMEESYRREIAREMFEKVMLQAQLQSKLLSMMEQRTNVKIQLDRLDNMPSGGNKENNALVPIPTAMCTPSPLSVPSQPFSSASDPPMDNGTDPDPCTTAVATCPQKAITPFGLSIVVEHDDGSFSVSSPSALRSIASPSAYRSFSPSVSVNNGSTSSAPAAVNSHDPPASVEEIVTSSSGSCLLPVATPVGAATPRGFGVSE